MKRLLKRILALSGCVLLLLTVVLSPAAAYDAYDPYAELNISFTDEFAIPSDLTTEDKVVVSAVGGGLVVRDGQYNGSYTNEVYTSELVYQPSGRLVYRLYDYTTGAELINLYTTYYAGQGCWAGYLDGVIISNSLCFTLNQSSFCFYGGRATAFDDGLILKINSSQQVIYSLITPESSLLGQIEQAQREAYNEGMIAGQQQGYSEGYKKGQEDASLGEGSAWQAAYDSGYNDGLWQGKQEGQTDALNSTSTLKDFLIAIVTAPGYLIDSILDFNLLGINVAVFVKTLLTLGISALIVWAIFKIVKG